MSSTAAITNLNMIANGSSEKVPVALAGSCCCAMYIITLGHGKLGVGGIFLRISNGIFIDFLWVFCRSTARVAAAVWQYLMVLIVFVGQGC